MARITTDAGWGWPAYKDNSVPICSHFHYRSAATRATDTWGAFHIDNSDYLYFVDNGGWISDLLAWKRWLTALYNAGDPVRIAYELQTPLTLQLTPQDITTFFGDNRLWANDRDVSVVYRVDLKKYLDERLAPLEALLEANNG